MLKVIKSKEENISLCYYDEVNHCYHSIMILDEEVERYLNQYLLSQPKSGMMDGIGT